MRKVLSFVLVLSLVLGSFGMAFAAPLSDMAGEESAEAVSVLTQLGVVKGYPDGTYKPDNIVTRAEMAVIVVSALGLADYATGTSSFSDMGGHWSNGFVAYATSLGVIAGYPDGTFRPDKTVSYDEAATMLVAALGYNADSLIGTWPANFVTKAKTLGILDGIKAGAAGANRGDIAIMAYQTLDQAIGKTNKDGDFDYDKDANNDPKDTMLSRLGVGLYDPDGSTGPLDPGDAFVVLGDEDSLINLRPFLGAYVTAYEDDGDIIAIKEVKSQFLIGEFAVDVVAKADILADADFEAEKDYTVKDAVDTDDIEFFKNGDAIGTGKAIVKDSEYKIAAKISGSRITDIYSVSEWISDDEFLFEDDMLEDDSLNGHDFALTDDDEIDFDSFELLGVNSLDKIEEDNVVYVYVNTAKDITKIEVGTEVVTGEVTKINAGATKVTIGGNAYEMWDGSTFSASLEDELELLLDYFGKAYDVDTIKAEADNYAVLLETGDGDAALNGKDGVVKLFLADGTDKIFTIDDDLVVAGVIAANGIWDPAYSATSGTAKAGTVVEYGVDKDGVLDALKIVALGSKITPAKELTTKYYYNSKAVASDAILFTYDGPATPAGKANEDNYGVTTVAKAAGKDLVASYLLDSGKITLMLVEGLGTSDEDIYGVVTSRAKTLDSSTDYQLTMLIDGEEVKYDVTKSVYDDFTGVYNYSTVYKLKLNTSDAISGLTPATTGADSETILATWTNATSYDDGVLFAGDSYTIDASGFAYKWNKDDSVYEVSKITRSNMVGNDVKLYDTDEDGVADLVLIQAATSAGKQAAVDAVAAEIEAQSFTGAADAVRLPSVPTGFTVTVKSSSDTAVYDTDGKIKADGTSNVVFTVKLASSTETKDAASVVVTVDVD